ncbi:hypothetical protein Gotur_003036 [Gossypium turneri]
MPVGEQVKVDLSNVHSYYSHVATPRRDNISVEKWMAILQNL